MIKKFFAISTAFLIISAATFSYATNITLQSQTEAKPEIIQESQNIKPEKIYKLVNPLQLVEQPSKFMGKKIRMFAKFDKFSAIGLDYEPASRDSKEYISFLIKRENVTNYNIPLSELKLIVKRDYAEKELVNLETGDEIEIYGNVFCLALGDPWVDVEKVKILTEKENKEVSEGK